MSAGRIVLIVVGSLFVLGAIVALFAGGGVIWASQYHKDAEGFHATDPMPMRSATYAVISDTIEIDRGASEALNWLGMDRMKLGAENDDPSRPVFIGIADAEDVDAYLSGVEHDEIRRLEVFRSRFDFERRGGSAMPEAPGSRDFWLDKAEGTGEQEIVFDIEEGDYTILVMNADASEGIDVEAVFGVKSSGVVVLIGVAFLVVALALLAGGIVMIVFGARSPRPGVPPAAPPAPAS
ncbi:MAG: hypothetical protein PHP28_05195 [Actinomycetota bacterium]|nr:hypothetical protein [Actinomycetota bacterium]MDD5666948.1 hypothetical protein [Actinomycetota bacterium]